MSEFKIYSLGIVVETKPPGTDYIMVTPIETLNIQKSGAIKDSKTKFEGTLKQPDSKGFKTEVSSTNYLKAKWLPLGNSNRLTAPDVVGNETVILFKFGDVDEYYWTTIFREVELRRQETVLYAFSDIKSGMSAFDKSTSYWAEVDTKNKSVKLHTSANDGELTEYDVIIDTKSGTFTIKDKKNNSVILTSATDTLTITTNNNVTIKSANTVNIQTGTSVSVSAGSSVSVTAPNILLNGNVTVSGNLSVKGALSSAGGMSTPGNVQAGGTIMDSGGNSNHHSH